MYELLKKDGEARRGRRPYSTRGRLRPLYLLNVGTVAAIKGAVSTDDLRQIGTQVDCLIPIISM